MNLCIVPNCTCTLDLTTSVGNIAVQKQQPATPPATASRHTPVHTSYKCTECRYIDCQFTEVVVLLVLGSEERETATVATKEEEVTWNLSCPCAGQSSKHTPHPLFLKNVSRHTPATRRGWCTRSHQRGCGNSQ